MHSTIDSSSAVEVALVRSRSDRAGFLRFPWQVYAGDPSWVPPLLIERSDFIDPKKHPFLRHGAAALFLARRGGEIVGRIMASDDPRYNAQHGANTGCFGLFECHDDPAVAHALLDAAAAWLTSRGRCEIMGPIDYSTNYVVGLLIEGFQFRPMVWTPHNPPFYQPLLESWGLAKATDFFGWWFTETKQIPEQWKKLRERFMKRSNVRIRCADLADFDGEVRRIQHIWNGAWQKNWGCVAATDEEFRHFASELKPVLVPQFTVIAEVDGEPAGFILGVPDINEALHRINGRLTAFGLPIGLAKLLYYKSRIKSGRLVALGVLEKYRRRGIAEMLVLHIMEEGMIKQGYVAELSQTLEDNYLINHFLESLGAKVYKKYRVYRKALASPVASG